jgi:hypothetical protein
MTTSVVKWSNVAVAIQSALGSAKTISAVTKASPAIASSTAHGITDGSYGVVSAEGMFQIDSRVFRVDAGVSSPADANSFALAGEDSTLYDTFTSGSLQVITFGTNMRTATGLSASGGDFDFIDVTTIHDNVRRQVPGLPNPASYSFENLWAPSDPALIALKLASDNQAQRAIRFTFASGEIVVFNGYVGCTLLPTGNAQDKVITQVVITMNGRPTIYAS